MFGQMQPIGSRSVQFINGRMSAEAYAMAPNSQEILMDMNRPVFYWKTTDASGMSSVQEYEFKLVEPAQQSYVTMDQLNKFKEEINESLAKLQNANANQNRPQGQLSMGDLLNVARTVTPEQAKQMVMSMVESGQLSQSQLEKYEQMARQQLGLG